MQMQNGDSLDQDTYKSISHILFFGVPSQGMDTSSLGPMVLKQRNHFLLASLNKEFGYLSSHSKAFSRSLAAIKPKIIAFYETLKSPTAAKLVRKDDPQLHCQSLTKTVSGERSVAYVWTPCYSSGSRFRNSWYS